MSMHGSKTWRRTIALAMCMALAAGCADEEQPRLAEYLDGLELDVPLEFKASVDLGEFDVPLTIHPAGAKRGKRAKKPVRMRLRFSLSAEAEPEHEAAVLGAYERHRGAMNDAILTIIRNSSVDDLADPRLATIKARMVEAVRPMLGTEGVRQFVLNDIDTESM